jgi:hypothetical protein
MSHVERNRTRGEASEDRGELTTPAGVGVPGTGGYREHRVRVSAAIGERNASNGHRAELDVHTSSATSVARP